MSQLLQVKDNPPRILVLEDELELREALLLLLQDEGYQVETAAQAQEAFQKALELRPEILVLDVRLPGPDGLEVLKQLKESNPDLLSLVVTGYASETDSIRAIRLGVGDYLKKPFAMAGFLAALEGLVRIALGRRELKRRKEASHQLAGWTLNRLSGAQEIAPHRQQWSWREVAERAYHAARRLGMTEEMACTLKTAILYTLLRENGELSEHEELLEQTLPADVLHLAQRMEDAPLQAVTPESLARFAVKIATCADLNAVRGLATAALQEAFLGDGSANPEEPTPRVSDSALLGMAKMLAASGDLRGAEQALLQVIEVTGKTRRQGEAYLELAAIQARSGRRSEAQNCLVSVTTLLSHLGPQESAELALEAGLVAIRLRFHEGKMLLARSVENLGPLGLTGQLGRATIALWCLGEAGDLQRDQALQALSGPHRHDLLVSCGSWLLPALLRKLPNLDQPIHRRVVHRLVRECPSTVKQFVTKTVDPRALGLLLDALEETEVGLQDVAALLADEKYPQETRHRLGRHKSKNGARSVPGLRLSSLGAFEVAVGDVVLEAGVWRTQKARFLLACLAARQGRPVANEILTEQFWPTSGPERAMKNLYQAASDVRKALATALGAEIDPLARSGAALGLSDSVEVWHDIFEFERAVREGEQACNSGDLERAREYWREAIRLHRGRYLEDCVLEWAEQSRRHFELMYETLLEKLAEVCLKLGHYRETVELAERLLLLDPCHQTAFQLVMEAYIGEGRPEEAVRQFERLRITLLNEFSSEPTIDCLRILQKAKLLM